MKSIVLQKCLFLLLLMLGGDIAAQQGGDESDVWADRALSTIVSPDSLSESLFASIWYLLFPRGVILGTCLDKLTKVVSVEELMRQVNGTDRYLIGFSGQQVYVSLKVGATNDDQLKAFVHACIVHKRLTLGKSCADSRACMNQLVAKGLSLRLLENKGWNVKDGLYLGFGRSRVHPMNRQKND